MQKIEVTIKPEHFKQSVKFLHDLNPLEIALHEQYPELNCVVGGDVVITTLGEYRIPTGLWSGAKSPFPVKKIDETITASKLSLSFIPTVKFNLIKK